MENNFEQLMARKSDADLMLYINNAERYTPEAVNAAIAELKKRGKHFEAEEIELINNRVQKQQEEYEMQARTSQAFWKEENMVADSNALPLYSPRAIYTFSFLFSTIAGSIMLAANVRNKKIKSLIISSGIAYFITCSITLVMIYKLEGTNITLLNYGLGILGGYLLVQIFWNKYIGKNTKFKARKVWKPLIICLLVIILIVIINISLQNP